MARYIDADTLEKDGWTLNRTYSQDLNTMVYEIKKLSDFPWADVVEVKHGKWIKVGDNSYRCSVCDEISCCNGNFCPDCGADMREEIENANNNQI